MILKNIRAFLWASVLPVVQANRKIAYNLRQKLLEKLTELEENDTEKVESLTPCFFLSKRDGHIRIIVDMRVANQAIQRDIHPILLRKLYKK